MQKIFLNSIGVPDTNVSNGSGGVFKSGNLTLPFEQHIPGESFLNMWTICVQLQSSYANGSQP